jgi:tetratricopeptide (TPR) repeat protein
MLEAAASARDSGIAAQARLVQARLATGDRMGRCPMSENLVAESPDNLDYRQLLAMTRVALGQMDRGREDSRAVTEAMPQRLQAWIDLIRVQGARPQEDQARQTLAAALAANPTRPICLWAEASDLERAGDFEAAIADLRAALRDACPTRLSWPTTSPA